MKLAYVVNARIPTEKAHGYQIMRTCLEWKKAGIDVTLYVPERQNHITEDAFSFYGLEKTFEVVYIPCAEWIRYARILGPLAFYLQSRSFLKALEKSAAIPTGTTIFSRNADAISFFSKRGFTCFYNAHNWPARNFLIRRLLRGAKGIICNSQGTETAAKEVLKEFGLPTVVVGNAADVNPWKTTPKSALRKELGLPIDKKIITYVGHLYGWKGTDIILPLGKKFKWDNNIQFIVIGGTPADIGAFSSRLDESNLKNISPLGFKKKELVPKYLAASDVLLLPNNASTEESMRYTSPIKLFEYMAAGVPIVASDLPSIRAILPDDAGFFAEPESTADFAAAIVEALASDGAARVRAARALQESEKYSWATQAGRAIEFIKNQ